MDIVVRPLVTGLFNLGTPTVSRKQSCWIVGTKPPAHATFFHGFEGVLHPRAGQQRAAHEVGDEHAATRTELRNLSQDMVHSRFVEVIEQSLDQPYRTPASSEPCMYKKMCPVLLQVGAKCDPPTVWLDSLAQQNLLFAGLALMRATVA